MGRDFSYYFDPPSQGVWISGGDYGGGYFETQDRDGHALPFSVSRYNDVLGYIDPDYSCTRLDIIEKLIKLSISLRTIQDPKETIEAIKVFSAVLGEMGSREEVWIHYG